MKYEKIYYSIENGKVFRNKEYTLLLKRIFKYFPLDWEDKDYSNCMMKAIITFLDTNKVDYNLIDETFLKMLNNIPYTNYSYFIDVLYTLFLPINLDYFGTYMEVFRTFLFHDLLRSDEEKVKKLANRRFIDLYNNYNEYKNDLSKEFTFSYEFDLPTLIYAYYFGNNLDLLETNKVITFYLDNRKYYLDKLNMNGLYFPYADDDTIPKFFLEGFYKIFTVFIPVLVSDYKRSSVVRKKIK